jgi:pyridoxine 5-phosphate synthase
MAGITVLVDHVAALREVIQSSQPDPIAAALLADMAGADGIGVYLREDRRHIQERDVRLLRQAVHSRLVLYMTATSEMVGFALDVKPERVVLLPPVGDEGVVEGGMDVFIYDKEILEVVDTLQANGISVGITVDPDPNQIKSVHQMHANWVQLFSGKLGSAQSPAGQSQAWDQIVDAVKMAHRLRLHIAVGGGLDYRLIKLFSGLAEIDEFSLGRSIVAKAVMVGMERAVRDMMSLIRAL